MNHTPGPWEVVRNYDNIEGEEREGRHTIKDSEGWNIARIWESAPNHEANARLIAAAPELLNELAKALYTICMLEMGMTVAWEKQSQSTQDIWRDKAIRKANVL